MWAFFSFYFFLCVLLVNGSREQAEGGVRACMYVRVCVRVCVCVFVCEGACEFVHTPRVYCIRVVWLGRVRVCRKRSEQIKMLWQK
jgi:hypothetical protein